MDNRRHRRAAVQDEPSHELVEICLPRKGCARIFGLSEVLMKIPIKINCNILLSVVFCTALVPSAYAGGDIFLQCAQQYPGDDAERLKCYDQLAAPAFALAPAVGENIVPNENAEASTTPATPAAVPTRSTERSYLTRVWTVSYTHLTLPTNREV